MKPVQKELEKAISKAKKYEKAQEVAEKIMTVTTEGDLPTDKIWAGWERALLTALVLHCALSPNGELSLDRIYKLVTEPDAQKTITNALARSEEKDALQRFEIALGLNPEGPLTKKLQTLSANRWTGTITGLATRMTRLRPQKAGAAR